MHTPRRHRLPAVVPSLLFAALTVGMNACSDAQGLESPLDASLASAGQAGLNGTWVLNRDLSDKPDHARPEDHSNFGGDRPDRPDRFRGEPSNIEDGTRPGRPFGREGMGHGGPRGLPGMLDISVTDEAVTFAGPGDRSNTLYTDGRAETHELPNGDEVQVQAAWSGGALVIVRNSARGTRTETFTVSNDDQQLIVTTHIEGAELAEAKEFNRVYDRS